MNQKDDLHKLSNFKLINIEELNKLREIICMNQYHLEVLMLLA